MSCYPILIHEYALLFYHKTLFESRNLYIFQIRPRYPCVNVSTYHRQLDLWLPHFHLSQMHFVDSEDLAREPWVVMEKLERFLGLEHELIKDRYT